MMHINKIWTWLVGWWVGWAMVGCTAVAPTPTPILTPTPPPFSRGQMLRDIAEGVLLPAHVALVAAVAELDVAVAELAAHPTATSLAQAQSAWQTANLAYVRVAPFKFTPLKESLLHNRLDNRPPRTAFVEESIASETPITAEFVAGIGSTSVGMGVMEYLLFDPVGGDTAVLDRLTTLPDASRRLAYLQAISQHTLSSSQALLALWQEPPLDYAQAFMTADMDGGDLQGSTNMLVNLLVAELEAMVMSRMGGPLGKSTGSPPRPELLESQQAQFGLPRWQATVATLEEAYKGGEGQGLDDYLDFLGATHEGGVPLTGVVAAQFTAVQTALAALEGQPINNTLVTETTQVEAAYQELRALLVLFKVDIPNQLGVTLTFNDNDGD